MLGPLRAPVPRPRATADRAALYLVRSPSPLRPLPSAPGGTASGAAESPGEEVSDEALMRAAREGDRVAFSRLARRHAARVVAYCARHTRDVATAEEVAQETWLALWSARHGYEPTARFVVWLYTAAKNRCRNVHRGRVRALAGLGRTTGDDPDVLADREPSALDRVLAGEARARVAADMDRLSEPLREALALRVVDELAYADVAAILEIPEATARTRVHLAVQKLRALARGEETP